MPGKKKRRKTRLAPKRHTYFILIFSLIGIVLFGISLFLFDVENEATSRIFSAGGTFFAFFSAGCTIVSLRDMFETGYELWSRIFCLITSFICMMIWCSTYMIGILSL